MAYLATRGRCWNAGSSLNGRRHDHDHDRDLLPSDGERSSQKWITIKSSSDGRRSMTKNSDRSPIVTRLRRDRSSIVPRLGPPSAWNRFHSIGRRATHDQDHDHGPIATRSWPDRGMIVVHLKPKLRLTYLKFGSYDAAPENRSHDALIAPPRTRQLPMIFDPILPLKSHVFLLCSSTFDRFVKELSEFRGRSLVHRDPPAFRLDCEAIGVGLIANVSLISSNFPLEFRTSTRKNPSKFASIHENWSLILAEIGLVVRFDRLSRGNLSFY